MGQYPHEKDKCTEEAPFIWRNGFNVNKIREGDAQAFLFHFLYCGDMSAKLSITNDVKSRHPS